MCRWLSYLGEPIWLEELLSKPDHSLIDQSLHALESKAQTFFAHVRAAMAAAGVEAPPKATLALSDGRAVYALRYASDAAPPTLYHARNDRGLIVVSEPLHDKAFDWTEVPPGQVLVSEAGADEPTVARF